MDPVLVRHRVPAEHRLAFLDRRTLPFAVVALVVWVLWAYVVPTIDEATPWEDPIRPGDVLQLTDDATIVPPVGWGLQSGLRTTDRPRTGFSPGPIVLARDGVLVRIMVGPWTGSAAELLRQVTAITTTTAQGEGFHVTSGADTFSTRDGIPGVLETFSSPRTEGMIAAVVIDDEGVQIQAVGPPDQAAGLARDVQRMLASISRTTT
jgi:hypothetical protein